MFNADVLTFREFAMREPLPLVNIQSAVMEFLRGRDDVAIFGIEDVLVMAPADLIASKVIAYHQRRGKPKSGTDWRDIAMLLLAFPELKSDTSPVTDRLKTAGAEQVSLEVWHEIVGREIEPPDDEGDF
jgi:hypothetical protein